MEVMSSCEYNTNNDEYSEDYKGNISPTVEKCLKRIAQEENFVVYNVDIQNISTNGGNYLANLQAINVKGKTKYDKKEINIFVKNRLVDVNFTALPFDEVYRREAFYYNELIPIYNKMQEKANVPNDERLKVVRSYNESNSDVTILENLSKKGYKTRDRLEPISLEFAEIAIRQLAKFHALSFALHENEPEYFENKIKPMKFPCTLDSDWDNYVKNICEAAADYLDRHSKDRLKKFQLKIREKYEKFVESPERSCICHGDFRANNMIILEKDGEIADLLPVDFQLMHYGSPVTDFIYFVFMGSDQNFRKDHLDGLKELYYETFKNFLKYFDIHSHDVYPKKRFEQEYHDNLDHGLYYFLFLLPFMFCSEDEVPELTNGMSGVKINLNNEAGIKRLRGVIEDFINWGYL